MKLLTFRLLCLFFLVPFVTSGQTNTSIGLEAAVTNDLFTYYGDNQIVSSPTTPSGYIGFTISEGITDNLSVETGVILKGYKTGYQLDIESVTGKFVKSSNGLQAVQFPIRLLMEHPLNQSNASIFTILGYHYCLSLGEYGGGSSGMRISSSNDSLRTSSLRSSGFEKSHSLLQAGLGFNYEFRNEAQVYISCSYYTGFKAIINQEIQYQINNQPANYITGISQGDFWGISIGYKHPFKLGGPPLDSQKH